MLFRSKKHDISVLAPDINESFDNFTLVPASSIRFGLAAIKNVGHNVVKTIVDERNNNGEYKSITDFLIRLSPKPGESSILNKKSLESLIRAGAFDKLAQRKELLVEVENLLEFSHESQKIKNNGQSSLFGEEQPITNKLNFSKVDLNEKRKLSPEEIQWEKDLLGMYVSDHPLNSHQHLLNNNGIIPIKEIKKDKINKIIKTAGVITKITKFITKSGKPMLFVGIEDISGKTEILVFANTLERNPVIWQEGKIIVIKGRVSDKDDQLKLLCDEAEEIISE